VKKKILLIIFVGVLHIAIILSYAGNLKKIENNMNKGITFPQNEFSRVRESRAEKADKIKKLFDSVECVYPPKQLLLIIYKTEQILEVWTQAAHNSAFKKLCQYSMTDYSGTIGPKRKSGDRQIPEGFYYIERYNPKSNFYLSLGINYPNKSDKIKSGSSNPGGDIFIHGSNVTIGCIPIGDDAIKELYLMALDTNTNSQKPVPVYIYPCKMSVDKIKNTLEKSMNKDSALKNFWITLTQGYNYFEKKKLLINYSIDDIGEYNISDPPSK